MFDDGVVTYLIIRFVVKTQDCGHEFLYEILFTGRDPHFVTRFYKFFVMTIVLAKRIKSKKMYLAQTSNSR